MYSLPHWLLGYFFITDFEQLDYYVQVIFILFRQSFLYIFVFWVLWIYSFHQIRKLWGHYFFHFYLFLSTLLWALLLHMFQNSGSCLNYCFSSYLFKIPSVSFWKLLSILFCLVFNLLIFYNI